MHKTNGVHKVSCFSSFLWGVFEMLITWPRMGCWWWDGNGREAQLCESLAEGSQECRAIYSLSTLVTAPDGWTPSGVSAGVARSCWGAPPGQGRWVLRTGTGLRSGGAVGTSGLVEPLHSFHLWNNPKPQTLSSLGTGWTSVTFVPLVIIHEPSNALGLFSKNLLVKPLSSRDLILLG